MPAPFPQDPRSDDDDRRDTGGSESCRRGRRAARAGLLTGDRDAHRVTGRCGRVARHLRIVRGRLTERDARCPHTRR